MSDLRFLFDENLIHIGRMLQVVYPDTIFICGQGDAPARAAHDPLLYRWCREYAAVLVTHDFNMLRDRTVLSALLVEVGLQVLWIRQIRGQTAAREAQRVVGRWDHICRILLAESTLRGFVLGGNGQLRRYRTLDDAVYEAIPSKRRRGGA